MSSQQCMMQLHKSKFSSSFTQTDTPVEVNAEHALIDGLYVVGGTDVVCDGKSYFTAFTARFCFAKLTMLFSCSVSVEFEDARLSR